MDSIGLVRIIETFNQVDIAAAMGRRANFTIAVACDPTRAGPGAGDGPFPPEGERRAHFTMTQPIHDPKLWTNFLAR